MKPLLGRIDDVAALLAISPRGVWSLVERGLLTPIRPDGQRICRFLISEVEALVTTWATSTATDTTETRPKTRRAGSRSKREDRLLSTGRREHGKDNPTDPTPATAR